MIEKIVLFFLGCLALGLGLAVLQIPADTLTFFEGFAGGALLGLASAIWGVGK